MVEDISASDRRVIPASVLRRIPGCALPPVRIHVGDDEVLLDDSRRYAEPAAAAGVDVRLDV